MSLENSKRIMVIGSGGSGKSTLAVKISKIVGIPVIHLDKLYWHNWVAAEKDEWISLQNELIKAKSWIIDGNYGGTMDIRLENADTIIFLDINRWVCIYSAIKRWITHIGKVRPDMGDGCNEAIDMEFLRWIYEFPQKGRVNIIEKLERYKAKNIIVIKSRKEIKKWLKELARC